MCTQNSLAAVYSVYTEVDQAMKDLQRGGIDMQKVSIIGKGYHTDEHAVGYYNTGDRMKYWGKVGAFWGGFWGLLNASGFFVIPGVGPPILAAGPIVAIVAELETAVLEDAASPLGVALSSMRIRKESIAQYEAALKTDRFLLLVQGTSAQVAKAKNVIKSTHPAQLSVQFAAVNSGNRRYPRRVA